MAISVGAGRMIKDWFHKIPLQFDVGELTDALMPELEKATWKDTHYSQAPGTTWNRIQVPQQFTERIERSINCKIFSDYYVWNYEGVKDLLVHKDNNSPGEARSIVGCLPLIGSFENQIYRDDNFNVPIDSCVYGPGEILILNNTKYFHGGRVLSDTRVSLHFYLEIFNTMNKPLAELLEEHRLDICRPIS